MKASFPIHEHRGRERRLPDRAGIMRDASDEAPEVRDGRPTRVLHIITRLIVGGAQENTLLTAAGQSRNPLVQVAILAGLDPGPEGDLHEAAREAGVELHLVPYLVRPIRPIGDALALLRLYRFLGRGGYDVVHTHSSKAGILGRIAAKWAGVPVVVHTVHGLPFHDHQAAWKNWLYVRLERLAAKLSDAVLAVSQKTIDGALAAGIGRPELYQKVLSGIDLEPFLRIGETLSPAEAKARLGIPANAPVVGKVARLFPLKGHDLLFDAARRIAEARPDCWFLLVGDGVLREELEARAKTAGIAERTVFTGLVAPDAVPRHLQAMDVVVHASLREGIARVLPQAGAVGKPVVTFELDGAPEVVEDGVSGYLVAPGDTAGLSERTLELLAAPELRALMGERARRFAAEHFPAARMVEAVDAVYARIAAGSRGKAPAVMPSTRSRRAPASPGVLTTQNRL